MFRSTGEADFWELLDFISVPQISCSMAAPCTRGSPEFIFITDDPAGHNRAGVDAGCRVLFAFERAWSDTTQRKGSMRLSL